MYNEWNVNEKCIRWRICRKYGSVRLKRDKNEK
jgi:hypothetical protein